MSSKNNAELTRRIVGSRLWLVWIWVCSGIVCLADIAGIITLVVEGVQGALYVLPIVFLAIDVAITLLSVFLNFRFRRALAVPIIYAVVKVLVVFAAIGTFFGDYIMFSTAAAVLWLLFEVVSIVCVLVSAVYAKGSGKSFTVVVAVLTAVIVILCGVYTYFVATNGFFGQSKDRTYEKRTLVYSFYDENEDSLTVSGVLDGSGDTVVIPESFNGLPVVGVDCRVFIYEGVDTIVLQCGEGTEFSNVENLCFFDDDVSVYVESDNVNYFRNYFYALAEEVSSSEVSTLSAADGYAETLSVNIEGKTPKPLGEALAGFANTMAPVVEDDQIFVSISIDYEYVVAIGGKIPDVWIGEKGESFDFYKVYGFDYLDHMDEGSEDDLYWCYENLGKYILLDVVDRDGKSVLGEKIETSSVLSYEMSRVYAVEIGESNDTEHTEFDAVTGRVLTSGFYPEGSSSGLGKRYVTENTADALFGLIDERTGFTLSWKAGEAKPSEKDITTFKGSIYDGMTVSPFWTMSDPVISEIYTDKDGDTAVYGNSVTFSVDASFADSDILLSYDWKYEGQSQSDESSFTLTNMLPSQSGTYVVTVTAGGDGNTSLTTSTAGSLYLTVDRRDVTLTWTTSTDLVYSGTEVDVSVSPNAGTNEGTSGTVNGDNLTFSMVKTGTIKDVGDYTVAVSLSDAWDELYNITNPSIDYTVTAYPLTVVWVAAEFTYDGTEQHPDYSYTGRYGETNMTALGSDTLSTALNVRLSYAGSDVGIDAGEHTATLSTENKNYTLLESSYTYGIAKKSVNVTWISESNFKYTYNSYDRYPTVETSDLVEGDTRTNDRSSSVTLIYSDYGKYAGTYTVSVSVNSDNYELEDGEDIYATSCTYTIDPKPVTITWQDTTSFEYDARNHTIEATINGIENSDLSEVYLSYWSASDCAAFEYGVNTGTYDIYATLSGERAGNYLLNDNYTTYTITPKSLTITAETLSKTYDSYAYADVDTYSYTELATGDDLEEIVNVNVTYTSNGQTYTEARDAREYTVTLTVTPVENAKYENYSITNNMTLTGDITISPAPLTLKWTYPELTYNSEIQQIYASVSGFVGTDAGSSGVTSHVSDLVYTITQSSATVTPKDAGTYYITASLQADVINYYIFNDTDASTSFEISPYTVELTWGENVITYTAEELVPTYSYEISDPTLSVEFGEALLGATVNGKIKDVGNSTAGIVIFDSNFEITNSTCYFEIVPVELTITWKLGAGDASGTDNLTYTYTAGTQGPVAVIDEGQVYSADSTSVSLTFTYSGTEFGGTSFGASSTCPINAGNYSVLTETNNKNYIVKDGYETRDFVINKATLEVVWDSNDEPFTYNGSSQQIYASVTGVVYSESIGSLLYTVFKGGSVTTSYSDADDYTIKASLDGSVDATKNYVLDEETTESSFTISPLEITITWSETTALTYCGEKIIPEYSYYCGSEKIDGHEMSTIMGVTESGAQRDVGSGYTAVISISNGNYTLTNGTETCSFSIVAKEIEITWDVANNNQYTYTAYGISPSATINEDQICDGDTVEIVYTYVGIADSSEKPVNVGTYTVTATLSNSNYEIRSGATTAQTFTITEATLTVTWDTATELTYNGESQQIYAHVTPLGGDTLELVYTITNSGNSGDTEHKDADTYGISVALDVGVKNYVLGDNTTNSFTIKPFEVTVVWDTTELTYDGTDARRPTATVSEDQIFGSDSVAVIAYEYSDGQSYHKDVGNYSVKATELGNPNYVIDGGYGETTFTINPRPVTISWDVENNHEYTYTSGGISPSATIGADQIYYGDVIEIVYTYSDIGNSSDKPVNVGTYTVIASSSNPNYVVKDESEKITFTIIPKSVTISWTTETFTYDGAGKTPTATITAGDVISGDTVYIVYTYGDGTNSAPVNAGNYSVTASSGNPNYVLSGNYLEVSFTINKATLQLVWPTETSYEYTGSPVEPTATFAAGGGPYNGDSVTLQYTYTENHTDVGSYSVTASSTNSNYEVDSSSKTFNYSITTKTVTVTSISWDRTTFTYNGNAQSPEATVTLSESVGYTIGYTYSKADNTSLGSAPTDAGSYTVTVTITLSNSNYSLGTTGATLYTSFTIEKAVLTVTWSETSDFSEGDDAMHPVATVSGWADEGDVAMKYTYAAEGSGGYSETAPSSAGTYTVKIELTYDENNYVTASDTVYEKSYTITAAPSGGAG